MEKELSELVKKLTQQEGSNLKSVVLYGSAATGEFHPKHSDLNVLCVTEGLDAAELERLNRTSSWWVRRGHPTPIVFSGEELTRHADIFAIELLDIQANRRVLHGEDILAGLNVPKTLHRAQVERELALSLLRLRQRYLSTRHDRKAMIRLMSDSLSTFATLFRHALMIFGESPPEGKRKVFDRIAEVLGFDARPFDAILDLREGKVRERDVSAEATFREYLKGVARVLDEVDRRLAA